MSNDDCFFHSGKKQGSEAEDSARATTALNGLDLILSCGGTRRLVSVDELATSGAPPTYGHGPVACTDDNGGFAMPVLRTLQEYLDQHGTKYQVVTPSLAYTALEVAKAFGGLFPDCEVGVEPP